MKRFILFYGRDYYPQGGLGDSKGIFECLDDALRFINKETKDKDWCHILDLRTGKTISVEKSPEGWGACGDWED